MMTDILDLSGGRRLSVHFADEVATESTDEDEEEDEGLIMMKRAAPRGRDSFVADRTVS